MDNFRRQTAAAREATSTDRPEAQQPPRLGGYRTGRLLGVGSSAHVWLVEDQRTGIFSALKVFPTTTPLSRAELEGRDGSLTPLDRELAVLGALKHPHLLGIRDVVSTDRGPGLLMDYAGGGSLLNLVTARGRLSVGECITVLGPIAQALAYLHSSAIQHGDVSPGNVLFTADGKPLLADLGVGRMLGEAADHARGTAGFAEAGLLPSLSAGFASDVFSAAAVGWYSLTGNPPDRARDRAPLSLLVPGVPGELLHILEAALHDDHGERPSANELADAVLRAAPAQPLDLVAAVHPSVLPQLLTRRATADSTKGTRRRLPEALARIYATKIPTTLRKPTKSAHPSTRAERSRRADGSRGKLNRQPSRARRRSARNSEGTGMGSVIRGAAALLVLCGVLLLGPQLLDTLGSSVPHSERGSAEFKDTLDAPAGVPAKPAAGGAPADSRSGNAPAKDTALTDEMTQRLADENPVTALSALVAVRAMFLATGEAGLLPVVNVKDSDAMAADRQIMAGLQERGHVFNGLSIRLEKAAPAESFPVPEGATAVTATAVMSGYTEMDASGAAVREVAESTLQDLVFVLVREEGVWRIASVHNSDAV
ncbi:serine/threonine-protein kinase [Arthrobacter parietis]|uniref:serine/threonine protein kinase n=1 Tax=Arthrobacter parietis TaxID=271434 RepID=UPI0031F97963